MPHISEAAPLQISRFYTGLYTYRNPLIVPVRQFGRRIIELYDAIASGVNMENSNRLTLARRPGYTAFNPNPVNGIPLYFYSFKPANFPNQIYTVADTTVDIEWIQPGNIPNTTLVTKTAPALSNFSQIGAFLYIANPNALIDPKTGLSMGTAVKWDSPAGAQGITKWGLDIFEESEKIGPNTFTGVENIPLSQPAPGWFNASVTLPPATIAAPSVSQFLAFGSFLFSVTDPPPPYVTGVEVTLTGFEAVAQDAFLSVSLAEFGGAIGKPKTVTLPANSTTVNLGGPSDLWQTNIQPHDVNQDSFGVLVQAINGSTTMSASFTVLSAQMTVFLAGGPSLTNGVPAGTTMPATGWLTAQVGYQYVVTYGNSFSGHVSSPSFPSVDNNGPNPPLVTPVQGVQVAWPQASDPQVNQVHFYRTTDGGGSTFYELPNSPLPNMANNPSGLVTITDIAQDWQLQIAQQAPQPHFNDPPPDGAVDPVWYAGRLWMHKQNLLFFSSGPDISQGNGPEAWFPAYVFEIPHAQIVRKFPFPTGMLVWTHDNVYVVRGTSTFAFTVTDFMQDTGMRTWTAGDTDGTNVYVFTSDRQLLMVNANGLSPIGSNVADLIMQVDPKLAYLVQWRYTQAQQFMFLGDSSTFLYPYNQDLQCWTPRQAPVGGVRAISNVEVSPGVFEFWRGKPSLNSTITFRDVTAWADEGVPYPCQVIFGPIPLADYLTLAQIRDVALAIAPTDTMVNVSVLPNEVLPVAEHQFQLMDVSSSEPPELSTSLSHRIDRYTWKSTTYPEFVNFIFLRIDFAAQPNPDELWCYTIGGTQTTGGSSLGQPGQLPQLQGR